MQNVNLKQRTFKGRWIQSSTRQFPTRSGTRRTWSDEAMQKAITAIEKEGVSFRQAAENV